LQQTRGGGKEQPAVARRRAVAYFTVPGPASFEGQRLAELPAVSIQPSFDSHFTLRGAI